MFQLLNRFAWAIAIAMGFIIMSIFWFEWFWIFIWIISIFAVKWLVFSEDFINSRLEFFAKQLDEYTAKNKEKIYNQYETVSVVEKEKEEDLQQTAVKYATEKIQKTEKVEKSVFEEVGEHLEKENVQMNLKTETKSTTNDTEKSEKILKKQEEVVYQPSKLQLAISNFFKENLLAKIGAPLSPLLEQYPALWTLVVIPPAVKYKLTWCTLPQLPPFGSLGQPPVIAPDIQTRSFTTLLV